jgi:putative flavoprotein involved in K+ transport
VHTADYRNSAVLPPGAVLVAGAGQSGCQIAADLLDAGRTVFLATCRVGRLPRRYRGRDIVVWMHACGIADELDDPSSRYRGQPQIGPFRTISLQSLSARGAVLLGRLLGAEGGELRFADDLAENMRAADAASEEAKRTIDAWIARNGLEAPPPEPDPEEEVAPRLPDLPILALDPARAGISTVIWGTGFGGDFSWLRLERVLDARGDPVHAAGVGRHPGLFYTGLPWLTARKSALVTGVAHDAPRIAALVAARCD